MITATRRLQFCAGHRVFMHESKCANMHGHNYVLFAEAIFAGVQDSIGRVVDFAVLKDKLGGWIDRYWDHGFLYFKEDDVVAMLFEPGGPMETHKSFPMPENPTAENMAKFLLLTVCPELFTELGVRVIRIRLEETENCAATVDFPGGINGPAQTYGKTPHRYWVYHYEEKDPHQFRYMAYTDEEWMRMDYTIRKNLQAKPLMGVTKEEAISRYADLMRHP